MSIWPSTVSALEAWWLLGATLGLFASAYDIERAVREARYHWLPDERAERGIAILGMAKAFALGMASGVCLLVGTIVGLTPQVVRTDDGILIADILAACFIVIEGMIVVVICIRDAERWFVQGFVWHVRPRTPNDPPPHAKAPPIQSPPERA